MVRFSRRVRAAPSAAWTRRLNKQQTESGGTMTMLQINTKPQAGRATDSALGVVPSITTPLPGPRGRAMIERDEKFSSPSYTRDYPLVVGRALGSVVEDVDGNRFLDLAAGI